MNFRRIQRIFLCGFIIVDLLIVGVFFQGIFRRLHQASVTPEQAQAVTLREMRAHGIKVPHLSTQPQKGSYVTVRADEFNTMPTIKRASVSIVDQQLNVTYDQPVKRSLATLKHQVLAGNQYHYDQKLSTNNRDVFTQLINGQPVLTSAGQLQFHRNQASVTGYSQGHLLKVTQLQQAAPTISQQQAVINLYRHNDLNDNAQIKDVRLGYAPLNAIDDPTLYGPVWQVKVWDKTANHLQTLMVSALTGTILQNDD